MKAPWQQARLEVLTRARNVQHHLEAIFGGAGTAFERLPQIHKDAAMITELDPYNVAMLRVYTDLIYERLLPEAMRERLNVILVHGLVAMTQHAWLCVEGKIGDVSPDAARCEALEQTMHISDVALFRWRVIIDVCAIDIEPAILLIAPTSPLMPQYTEQERFTSPVDYSKELTQATTEGVARMDQESLILKALVNKHAR